MPINEIKEQDLAVREISEEEVQERSAVGGLGGQFLAGVNDVTEFLVRPLERTIGTVVIGPEGIEAMGPEETARRREEGTIGLPGMALGEPKNILERGMRVGGQTAAIAPLMGYAASFVPAATPAATTFGKIAQFPRQTAAAMGETFAKARVATTLIETGLGVTAGMGGGVAEKLFPDSEAAKFFGEIIGGTAPTLMPARFLIRAGQKARDIAIKLRHPFTVRGGKGRAAARAARAVPKERKAGVISELDKPTTIDPETGLPVLTPAQRTQEPGLLSLERAVMESSEELTRDADAQIARANQIIQQQLRDIGTQPPSTAAVPIDDAQRYLDNLLDTRVRIAAQRANERMADLGTDVTRETANRIAREELESAFAAGKRQSDELFKALPEDAVVGIKGTIESYRQLVSSLSKARRADMPAEAKRLLARTADDFLGDETTILEIRGLQSKLRETARNARAGDKKNLNKARIADTLANAIDDDLMQMPASGDLADNIQVAIAFYRNMNERFNQGSVGKILQRRVTGEAAIAPSLTLEQSIGMTGPKAREAFDQLLKAFDSPEAPGSEILVESAEHFIRSRFLNKAVERGKLNIVAARRFIANNEEILNRLPRVKRQIEEALMSGDQLRIAEKQRARVHLDDPRVSKATLYIQKGPVETFRQISKLSKDSAAREMQKLINRVGADESGEALAGLKSGFVEYLLAGARQSVRDIDGTQFISGFAVRDQLANPSTQSAAVRLFSKEELHRIDVITRDLIRLEKRRGIGLSPEGVIGDTPSRVVETIAGITGAAVGRHQARQLGIGGTVQIPGIMANRFRDLISAGVKDPASRLMRDAVTDEKLFRELLEAPLEGPDLKMPESAKKRLNAWAAAVLAEHGGAFKDDE